MAARRYCSKSKGHAFALLPMGRIPQDEVLAVATFLKQAFCCPVAILPATKPAEDDGFEPALKRWDASLLLHGFLLPRLPDTASRLIGLFDEELLLRKTPGIAPTAPFGLAGAETGVVLVSRARLAGTMTQTRSRLHRVIMHELGHTFGLGHCNATRCLMRQVRSVEELEAISSRLCPTCRDRLRSNAKHRPDQAKTFWTRGSHLLEHRRFPSAIRLLRRATERAPNNPVFLADLAHALLLAQRNQEARPLLEKAVQLDATLSTPCFNLGLLAYQEGRLVESDRWFEEWIKRHTNQQDAHRSLVRLYSSEGLQDPGRAERHYRALEHLSGDRWREENTYVPPPDKPFGSAPPLKKV